MHSKIYASIKVQDSSFILGKTQQGVYYLITDPTLKWVGGFVTAQDTSIQGSPHHNCVSMCHNSG